MECGRGLVVFEEVLVRYRESRHQRRVAKRAAERSEREKMLERFGADADEREKDRRRNSAEENERILREMGVTDRRRLDRRRR